MNPEMLRGYIGPLVGLCGRRVWVLLVGEQDKGEKETADRGMRQTKGRYKYRGLGKGILMSGRRNYHTRVQRCYGHEKLLSVFKTVQFKNEGKSHSCPYDMRHHIRSNDFSRQTHNSIRPHYQHRSIDV